MKKKMMSAALLAMGMAVFGNASESVKLMRIVPDKIVYRFKDNARAEVVVRNMTVTEQKGELRFVEEWGLDDARELGKQEVVLSTNETKKIVFSWNVGSTPYGRAVRAEFSQAGKIVSRRAEFFNVINDWWRVNIINTGWATEVERKKLFASYGIESTNLTYGGYGEGLRRQGPGNLNEWGPFESYHNMSHWYAWAPSDFADLTPDVPAWYSGLAGFSMNKEKILKDIAAAKKWGISVSAYTAIWPDGPAGLEFARQHPEWIVRSAQGGFAREISGFGALTPISPVDMAKPVSESNPGCILVYVDGYWPEAIQFGAQELVESIRMFGWDAIYFDGHYTLAKGYSWDGQETPHGKDPEEISARNVRIVQEIVRKEFPDTYLWVNGGVTPPAYAAYERKKARLEMLRDPKSGTLFECQGVQIADPNFYGHAWRSLFEIFTVSERDARMTKKIYAEDISASTENTGYVINYDFGLTMTPEEWVASRNFWVPANHWGALTVAANFHPCCDGISFRPITQFITRYSELYWHPDVKLMPNAGKKMTVDSTREVWWEQVVYTRATPEYTDYYIHLINAPDKEQVDMKDSWEPAPADDVEVLIKEVGDAKGVKAWALQPYEYESVLMELSQTSLTPEQADNGLRFKVPPFRYYTLLVVRQLKKT